MPAGTFLDATLLLIAHGSTVNADSAVAPFQHAAALAETGNFADVRVCFWKQPPFIRDTLNDIHTVRVLAVPLFLSDGYFTSEIIPRELGLKCEDGKTLARVQGRTKQTLYYAEPIGTSHRMTDVILTRVREVLAAESSPPPPRETALVLAAHGTNKNGDSRRACEQHVKSISALNRFAEVHAAFMEEEPRISDTTRFCIAPNVVVIPFFISDGLHAREDVPILLGESPDDVRHRMTAGQPTFINPTERNGKRIWYSASIGTTPMVTDVIMDRVRQVVDLTPSH